MLLNYTVQYTADNFWGLLHAIQSMRTQFNLNTGYPQDKAGDTLRLSGGRPSLPVSLHPPLLLIRVSRI